MAPLLGTGVGEGLYLQGGGGGVGLLHGESSGEIAPPSILVIVGYRVL
jgi:hypothetical protein